MRPESIADDDAPWQQRKSSQMRVRILEATIDCLVEKGYAGLTTNEIVQRTGVSRGAMHHHFPQRAALVEAVVEYALYQRMHMFLDSYQTAFKRSKRANFVEVATELHWRNVQSREFGALLELMVASRTDKDLADFFIPALRKYDKVWADEMMRNFPEWASQWQDLQVASDFAMAAHVGLLLYKPMFSAGRTRAVRDLISKTCIDLHG